VVGDAKELVRVRRGVVGLVAAAGLLVAGCGGDDTAAPPPGTTTAAPSATVSVSATETPSATSSSAPVVTPKGPPEPTPVGDTSTDGLWARAAEVVCADLVREASKPKGTDPAAKAVWVRERAWLTVDRLEGIAGVGPQGKEMRDILYAIGTQSEILGRIYQNPSSGNAPPLEQEIQRYSARLGRYTAALKAPSCADVIKVA
jgi:hypothetical protein